MKPELHLECDPTLPDGEMVCFDAEGTVLSRQASQDRPPEGCTRVAMSSGDYALMLRQLGITG